MCRLINTQEQSVDADKLIQGLNAGVRFVKPAPLYLGNRVCQSCILQYRGAFEPGAGSQATFQSFLNADKNICTQAFEFTTLNSLFHDQGCAR